MPRALPDPRYFLAIDVGGTSTRAAIVEPSGRCSGRGTEGSGNPTASGVQHAAGTITGATTAALRQAGIGMAALSGAVAAIAGASGRFGAELHRALVESGLPSTLSFHGDLLATFCSGTLADEGYAVVSGTGAIAGRIRNRRLEATGDGLGWLLGDGGSGFWIGRRVVRAAAATLDGRGPPTSLAGLVLADVGSPPIGSQDPGHEPGNGDANNCARPDELRGVIDALYQLRPVEIARFAPLAFAAAAAGDATARRIIDDATGALAATASTVAVPEVAGPVVMGGSVLSQQPAMVARLTSDLHGAGLDGPFITVPDGTVGAAVLVLRDGGVDVDDATFRLIASSLQSLR